MSFHLASHICKTYWLSFFIKKIFVVFVMVHSCIVKSPYRTNVSSVHCTIQGCVDKNLKKKKLLYIINDIKINF